MSLSRNSSQLPETASGGQAMEDSTSKQRKKNTKENEEKSALSRDRPVMEDPESQGNKTEAQLKRKRGRPRGKRDDLRPSALQMQREKASSYRREHLRRLVGSMLCSGSLIWNGSTWRERGIASGMETAVLWCVGYSMIDEIRRAFSAEARERACRFLSFVLTGEKGDEVSEHDSKRTYGRNLQYLTEMACSDLANIMGLKVGEDVVREIEGLCENGKALVVAAVENGCEGAFLGLLSPVVSLCLGMSYAFACKNVASLTHETFLELNGYILFDWMRAFTNPSIALDKRNLLLDQKGEPKQVFRILLFRRLFDLLYALCVEWGLGPFMIHQGLEQGVLLDLYEGMEGAVQRLRSFEAIETSCHAWTDVGVVLNHLLKLVIDDIESPNPGMEDVTTHLGSSPMFENEIWNDILAGQKNRRQCVEEKVRAVSVSLSEFLAALESWKRRAGVCFYAGSEVPTSVGKKGPGFLKMGKEDLVFFKCKDILQEFLNFLKRGINVGFQMLRKIEESEASNWNTGVSVLNDVDASALNNVDALRGVAQIALNVSRMCSLSVCGMLGARNAGIMLQVYEESIISSFLNKLNPETGARLGRVPLRVRGKLK